MAITFQAENTALPNIKKRATSNWIKAVAEEYGKKAGDISYIFCDDAKILEINRTYLHHDFYTDIITFDYSEGDRISGDIFIGIDTVRSNAEKYGTNFDEELHRVIIHGILHLCGLKDKSETDSKKMRNAEDKALSMLNNTI
jgi:rRNA maturation RNase YbeY